ncbi:hypothetical protein AtNW77_Chr3g0213411 [Arabidopsis thaliana]
MYIKKIKASFHFKEISRCAKHISPLPSKSGKKVALSKQRELLDAKVASGG